MESPSGRYVIGLEKVEQIPENGDYSAITRLTFYLEIPDVKNPQNERWKLRFRCNLYENPESIDLRQSGIEEINDEVNIAIRNAITKILLAMQGDLNSIIVGHDYIFYPELSSELIKTSITSNQPEVPEKNRLITGPRLRTASAGTTTSVESVKESQPEQVSFITLKAPFHVHPILGQINHVLSKPGEAAPFIVLPGNASRPIIELPHPIADMVLQNIDNIIGAVQNANYIPPQDLHYYSLPSKTVCTNIQEVSGTAYHSSAPNTVNRQSGSNLIGNKAQIYSSGTNSTGSLSMILRDFTNNTECSSDPVPSTPVALINKNFQDIQQGFALHRNSDVVFNEHVRMPPIQRNLMPFSVIPVTPTVRRGSANILRSFSPSPQQQLGNVQQFQFSSMKPPIYTKYKMLSPSRHNCVTFSDQIRTHHIPQAYNMFEAAKLTQLADISSVYQPRHTRAASGNFDFNGKGVNLAINPETPATPSPMSSDLTQLVSIKPEVTMMSSPSPQIFSTSSGYYVVMNPLQAPKKCISCPSILSDIPVSPIQQQPHYSASHTGPDTSNVVRVGIRGTSSEFDQSAQPTFAISQIAAFSSTSTSEEKKVSAKFTVTPAKEY